MQFLEDLWREIEKELNERKPEWKTDVDSWYNEFPRTIDSCCPAAAKKRKARNSERQAFGGQIAHSDQNLFKCFVFGILTSNVDARKLYLLISRGLLPQLFFNYDPEIFHTVGTGHIDTIVTAFKSIKAGGLTLKKSLEGLQTTAGILVAASKKYGSISNYLFNVVRGVRHPICLACLLGTAGSHYKLPGFGIPLAAESLKNMCCQLSKPDRHILRAAGCFGLVNFKRWGSKSQWTPPAATEDEMRETMWTMELFAHTVGVSVLLLDYAIWTLCAKSGLHKTNQELQAMAARCASKPVAVFVEGSLPCDFC